MKENEIDLLKLPNHIAIIMDGNGRWANARGQDRLFGHEQGIKSVRQVVETAIELGIKYLTLYTFSTENWQRPGQEVLGLIELFSECIIKETPELHQQNICLKIIGNINDFPEKARENFQKSIQLMKNNQGLELILALSYSSRWEINDALKQILELPPSEQKQLLDSPEIIKNYLNTKNIPDPDLLIRTGGEIRISNFLLYQLAYTELYFTQVLWPDFNRTELIKAILDFQHRQRRFGQIGQQILTN
ncbi:MAG: polyprenyl diphosphate synthase [Sediminibacterium sp.]|nr:polyprenyl diphosphate synthase [Sediminibacterium sp.]